jgi:hypothetical protein
MVIFMKLSKTVCSIMRYAAVFFVLLLTLLLFPRISAKAQIEDILKLTTTSSTWQNGYNMTMKIENTSDTVIDGWTLKVNKSDFTITSIWCAKAVESGDSIIITPDVWNKTIDAGANVSFGFTGKGILTSDFTYNLSFSQPSITPIVTKTPTIVPTPIITKVPTISPTPSPSGKFHVFLLLGQSNMAGYPKAQASDMVEDPRILVLGYDNNPGLGRLKDQWDIACAPLHETYQGAIGPGDWFAKTIIEKVHEGDTIGLVPCAISGERIETFMKSGGSKYDWIVNRARLAQQKGGIIEGILFHQGESNNGDASWPGKVNTLVEDLKKDLNLSDIPFIAGELLYSGGCAGHNKLVNKLPSIVKNCSVVSAKDLVADPSDTQWRLHFGHDSQVTLGKRYAEKMLEALSW